MTFLVYAGMVSQVSCEWLHLILVYTYWCFTLDGGNNWIFKMESVLNASLSLFLKEITIVRVLNAFNFSLFESSSVKSLRLTSLAAVFPHNPDAMTPPSVFDFFSCSSTFTPILFVLTWTVFIQRASALLIRRINIYFVTRWIRDRTWQFICIKVAFTLQSYARSI